MLIDMYMKCCSLSKAHQTFCQLPVWDVVAWTTMIAGYAEHGLGQLAIKFYDLMQSNGIRPNSVTFVCILKACGSIGAIQHIRKIQTEVEAEGLLQGELVGNTLIDMYATCGRPYLARQIFDKLPKRDVVSWNSLIKGYTESEQFAEVLKCFEQMKTEGLCPSSRTFVSALKACAAIGHLDKGEEICNEVERQGQLTKNPFIGCALIAMYMKCGALAKAQKVFDKVADRDVVMWTALIKGYVDQGHDNKALEIFEHMKVDNVPPNEVTFILIVKACANVRGLDRGSEIHAEIERQGLFQKDLVIGNSLVDMYGKCGDLAIAQEVFDRLSDRDIVSWNALIGGFIEHGFTRDALMCYEHMKLEGVSPDAFTFVYCLKACGTMQDVDKGAEVHLEIECEGLLTANIIGNALVDMYAKCGLLSKAEKVFDKLLVRDVISWTALITGYTELGDGENALQCFDKMHEHGIIPNAVTLLCCLKACTSIGSFDKGAKIHSEIERQGLLQTDLAVGNALIDMYAKCGSLDLAQQVFDRLTVCDAVSWNTLIAGYTEHGDVEDALLCFERMQSKGVYPNIVTFLCILKACSSIGAAQRGTRIHAEIERRGLLSNDLIGNTVVNMYAKCGSVNKAMQVFNKLPIRDVVSWTALMAGFTEIGQSEEVFYIFDRMLGEGIKPNPVTFVVVLTACTRKGLFMKCHSFFEAMSASYGVPPNLEHHSCVIDLLSRRGEVEMAVSMVMKMPFAPSSMLWHTVLGACRNTGSVQFGKQAFNNATQFHYNCSIPHMYPSNIYALQNEYSIDETRNFQIKTVYSN
ncbi:hypothetical protein KP509_27G011000 [Ceratopteris richardii]|nr:hypothetical protein KP509_27G011000 [Ceratopteris richardii]